MINRLLIYRLHAYTVEAIISIYDCGNDDDYDAGEHSGYLLEIMAPVGDDNLPIMPIIS